MEETLSQRPPFHLSYYGEDLGYHIHEVSLVRDCHTIQKVGSHPSDPDFFLATNGPDYAFVRVFHYRPTHEYQVSMTLTSWLLLQKTPSSL